MDGRRDRPRARTDDRGDRADAGAARSARAGAPWSLQTRLMVTITSIVALILVGIAVAISAFLGQVLQENLDGKVEETATVTASALRARMQGPPSAGQEVTATDVLTESAPAGDCSSSSAPSTARPDRCRRRIGRRASTDLTTDSGRRRSLGAISPAGLTLGRPSRGSASTASYAYQLQNYVVVVGLPLSEVQKTITQIITAVLLVTDGGSASASASRSRSSCARASRPCAPSPTPRHASPPLPDVGGLRLDRRARARRPGRRAHRDRPRRPRPQHAPRPRRRVARRRVSGTRSGCGASSPTRATSCALRSRRSAAIPSCRSSRCVRPRHPGCRSKARSTTTGESLERIQAQSLRMTTLVEDLLLLARLDEGQELVYGTVDLTRLAIEAVGDARPAGPDHVWKLDVGEEPVVIAGDASAPAPGRREPARERAHAHSRRARP